MVYLDYNASTPLDPRVSAVVAQANETAVNPGSIQHSSGQSTRQVLQSARESLADLFTFGDQEVIFTAGASESIFIGVLGVLAELPTHRRGIVLGATEHKATIEAAHTAQRLCGAKVAVLPVDREGLIDTQALRNLLSTGSFGLVAVMHANNETGVIQDVAALAAVAHEFGALFLCDATQSIGKVELPDFSAFADLVAFSGHKFFGPKGSGVLLATRDAQKAMTPLLAGGGQERGLRGGTPNTPAAAGLAAAAEFAFAELEQNLTRAGALTSALRSGLRGRGLVMEEVGAHAPRLSNTVNIRIVGIDAEALMAQMPHIEISTGSACNSAVVEPSHVLLAHGLSHTEAGECVRISHGKWTTDEDIDGAIESIDRAVSALVPNRAVTSA